MRCTVKRSFVAWAFLSGESVISALGSRVLSRSTRLLSIVSELRVCLFAADDDATDPDVLFACHHLLYPAR